MDIRNKEDCINAIKSIGQSLIDRAEDICNDLDKVTGITIYANMTPLEIVNFDITKNYHVNNDYLIKKRKEAFENLKK